MLPACLKDDVQLSSVVPVFRHCNVINIYYPANHLEAVYRNTPIKYEKRVVLRFGGIYIGKVCSANLKKHKSMTAFDKKLGMDFIK